MRKQRRAGAARRRGVAWLGLVASLLPQCRPRDDSSSGFPRAETLYIAGRQWSEPSSFNPLLSSADFPLVGSDSGMNLLYESLFMYEPRTGELVPLLAESYAVTEDAVEIVLNPAARWNDGKALTASDVAYTFDLGKRYRSLTVSPLWKYIREVQIEGQRDPATGGERLRFVLDREQNNPLVVLDALQTTNILPRHVIEPRLAASGGDLDSFTKEKFDQDPVGSGPYRLLAYSGEKVVMVRDDGYWGNAALHGGKEPAPKYVIHPIYKGNDHYSVALQQGRLDVSSSFVPRIWLKRPKGVRSWYDKEPFFVSACIPMLWLNVLHRPLDDVRLRRAMGFAVDYRAIRELAVSGYSDPLEPGLIMPNGLEAKFYSKDDAEKYGVRYAPDRARALLHEAGYTAVYRDGELVETRDASGARVPTLYIKSPAGWTDWESIVRIVVKSLREVGIDARERFMDASLYQPAVYTGDFDLILWTPESKPGPSQPWLRLQAVLTTREWAREGEKVYKNFGRFNDPSSAAYDPRFDALLKKIPGIKDPQALVDAYREINVLFMQAMPTIPLVYRADEFYEFSERHWRSFASADDPYVPQEIPGDRMGTLALWHIQPVGQN